MCLSRPKRITNGPGFSQRHHRPRPSRFLLELGIDPPKGLHRSEINLDLIRDDILQFKNSSTRPVDPDYERAVAYASIAFALPTRQKMLHLNEVFDYDLPIWKSAPGLPWNAEYKTKGDVVADDENRKNIRWYWHNIKHGVDMRTHDCQAFVRSHIAKDGESKTRAVWGYPLNMVLGEAVFAVPLIEAYKKGGPIAYGYEPSKGGMAKLRQEASKYKWYSAFDFRGFDKTVPAWLIRDAFRILYQQIDFTSYRNYGTANAYNNLRMWDKIVDYYINTPIRMANGERYLKRSGVASGSYFTQLGDSVINYILLVWAFIKQTGRPPHYLKVMGDDSFAADDEPLVTDDVCALMESIDMYINKEKSVVTRDIDRVKFMGFQVNYGFPKKEFQEWMALLTMPEHMDKSWSDVASRALGLLYANLGVCSEFDAIARAIVSLAPYDLHLPRSLARMLWVQGISTLSCEPPSEYAFFERLRIGG